MPRLGWTMEEGALAEWLKQPGERVEAGEVLLIVESDKALNEVESFDAGILHIPEGVPGPGETVPVGTVLGYLLAEGEAPPTAPPAPAPATAPPADGAATSATAASTVASTTASTIAAPDPGSGAGATRPAISPRARRLAGELGVDWERLRGTGRTGRITEDDVRAAAAAAPECEPVGERVPMSPIRHAIAERLGASHHDTAPVTLTAEVDATALVELRSQARPRPAYNDYLIHFAAAALEAHPVLNATLHDGQIVLQPGIHIGLAVDTQAGLLVPVVRDANRKTVAEIARETAGLAGKALRGELSGDEMTGGTFTITNLGAAGIDAFTPIINPPQCAVLGVGRIAQRPAVRDGQIVPRWLTVLSLTFDHRLVDGGPAAKFLATLRDHIEAPASALTEGS